jgi:hypothetical protein
MLQLSLGVIVDRPADLSEHYIECISLSKYAKESHLRLSPPLPLLTIQRTPFRWYLGIQSKKDPSHVMTEVYKAMQVRRKEDKFREDMIRVGVRRGEAVDEG